VLRKAIELKPVLAEARLNLGRVLSGQGRFGEAEAAYRKAIELKPAYAEAFSNLGNALARQGRPGEAEAAYRKAIALKPELAEPHNNLGNTLSRQGRIGEAEAAYRKAIALKPDFAEAHIGLGTSLMRRAQFPEAAASLKKAGELFPERTPGREQARQLRQLCQRYLILDARLPRILEGREKPASAAEQFEFARLCYLKKLYAAAARFARDAFTAGPKLLEAVPAGTRYNAACSAALAGCGQGKDADQLDDQERTRWRRQALAWLRHDLTWWGKALAHGNAQTNARVRLWMRHWQHDGDLAGVRAGDALARLPDEERKQWESLWADVDALLRRVSAPD
jgi:tetratricopeptide (TPR) repeat protein